MCCTFKHMLCIIWYINRSSPLPFQHISSNKNTVYFYIFLSVFHLPMIYCDLKCSMCQLIGSSHMLHNILEHQTPLIVFRLIYLISASTCIYAQLHPCWGYTDCVFQLYTGGIVTVYSSYVLGVTVPSSDCVFQLCTGGIVTVYSICKLRVQ